jgi:hypothetical protein
MKLDQITALPLGSRTLLNSWDDTVDMAKTKPVQVLSARAKMPFEITPSVPYLTRYQNSDAAAANLANADVVKQNANPNPNPKQQ